jgi:hypothetical protein
MFAMVALTLIAIHAMNYHIANVIQLLLGVKMIHVIQILHNRGVREIHALIHLMKDVIHAVALQIRVVATMTLVAEHHVGNVNRVLAGNVTKI